MPAVFTDRGFRFHFYSREGEPLEPIHVHVAKRGKGDAKLWLYPDVRIAYSHGFETRIQHWIIGMVISRRAEIERA